MTRLVAELPRHPCETNRLRRQSLDTVARFVHRLADGGEADAQLLARFRRQGDERAYGELVRRHGPMILSVCYRVLQHHHDAEDAFQATFLVLARKADAIRQDQSLGGWLFQVAHRLALRLRGNEQRRRGTPLEGVAQSWSHEPAAVQSDLQPVLDEELARLPERYRAAVVLCYLEGRSQREAAAVLTTTPDAVNSVLKRAREMLRARLLRRGVTLSLGAVAALLTQAKCVALAPLLITNTAHAACQCVFGSAAAATPRALALARGEVFAMTPLQKVVACFLLIIGCLLGAAGGVRSTETPEAFALGDTKKEKEKAGKVTLAVDTKAPRHCILLWLGGGPSQLDTFDLKPGAATGGPFRTIPTAIKGVEISEHLPKLAKLTNHLAILRAVSHREGDHGRATFLMRSGRLPDARTTWPPIPAVLAKELGDEKSDLPGWVCIGAQRFFAPQSYSAGFLGQRFGPLVVSDDGGGDDLTLPALPNFKDIAGDRAEKMRDKVARAFTLDDEKAALRDAYGRNRFGQGCLLARRLLQQGVPVVEVTLPGWDTHGKNFPMVESLSKKLDAALATLLTDLRDHKLLDRTLVVCMGEFGRTPRINATIGRDHWPQNFCVVLSGAGIAGGKVVGTTNADGTAIMNGAVSPQELTATIYRALRVDPTKEYRTNLDEKMPLVEKGTQAVKGALR